MEHGLKVRRSWVRKYLRLLFVGLLGAGCDAAGGNALGEVIA